MLRVPRAELHGLSPHGVIERHIDDIVVKALCARHNQALSPLDQAASDVANALRAYVNQTEARRVRAETSSPLIDYVVDGRLFERAMFKMAINAGLARHRWVGGIPPAALVEMVFGLREPSPGAGLGALDFQRGESLLLGENFSSMLISDNEHERPFAFILDAFDGFSFACTWRRKLEALRRFEPYTRRTITHPLAAIHCVQRNVRITFDHSGKWGGEDAQLVIELRRKFKKVPRK
jgi:hypothetical protein